MVVRLPGSVLIKGRPDCVLWRWRSWKSSTPNLGVTSLAALSGLPHGDSLATSEMGLVTISSQMWKLRLREA
jgi:hypothetical protein